LNSPNRFADDECFAMGGRKDTTTPNSAVDSCLDTAILEWGGTSGAEALLHVLVNRYADTGLEETSFNKHMVTVKQVTEGTSQWNDLVGGLRRAYDGTFAATFSPPAAHKEFPAWTTSQQLSRDLSRLLTRMGETKESNTSDDQSASVGLSYYATAWGLDHSNAKAALHAATVLQNHPDIAQRDELTMSLVNESVPGKTEKEDENWPQLVRLHLVLGDILSSTGECGSDANSASPFYQYEKALALEKKNRPNDAYSRSPELNRRLADCYKRLGNGEQAAKFNKDVVLSLQQYRPLTPTEDKLRYHIRSLWYPGGIMKSGVQAGLLMALDTPEKWHQGPAGFFRRFANSHATRAVRQGLAFGLDSTLHEDPHFLRSPVPGFRRRFLYSIKQTFLCQNDELSPTFATFRVGSAFGSEFISNAWRPSGTGYGDSNTRGAVLRALAVLGGDTAGNVFQEFITQRGKIGRFFAYVVNK